MSFVGIGHVGEPFVQVKGFLGRKEGGEMKRIIFADGMANFRTALEAAGGECFTVRKYREGSHDYQEKEIVRGEYRGALDILLQITRAPLRGTFKKLKSAKRDLRKKGYYFNNAWFESLQSHYPDLTWETEGVIVFYEILKIDDIPVVNINGHVTET